jgi:hypothetical protein
MRWIAVFVYAGLLLLGFLVITGRQRPSPDTLIATHNLAPNRLLQPGDVAAPSNGVQYIKRGLKAGDVVKPGDTSGFPMLNLEEGIVPVMFTVGAGLVESGDVNAGVQVQICKGDEAKIKSALVKAVVCDPNDTVCLVVVGISADQSAGLSDLFSKAPLPSVKAIHANSAC